MQDPKTTLKNILITTEYKGVFFAQVEADEIVTDRTLTNLKNARMVLDWGTIGGVLELAKRGPTKDFTKIGMTANIAVLHSVTMVVDVTDEAAKKWKEFK